MKIEDYDWVPGACKEIEKLCENDPTLDLDTELAKMVADKLLDTIKPAERPPIPEVVATYRALSKDGKFKFDKDNPEWRKVPTVADWVAASGNVDSENQSHIHWLKEWGSKDIGNECKYKIKDKLKEFIGLDRQATRDVKKVCETFGGKVVGSNFARPKDILYTEDNVGY